VLFELAHRDAATATEIGAELGLDAGYLSRMLAGLARRRLIQRRRSAHDGRQAELALTPTGRTRFAALDRRASDAITEWLAPLDRDGKRAMVDAMARITALLDVPQQQQSPLTIRTHRAGDLGWVLDSHAAMYFSEYGWDARFEALVARIVADFLEQFDPTCERCWIAERHGERVGSIFVVRHPERAGVAKLRLLLVDPSARGLGIGAALVDECLRFARVAGYHTMTLWTQDVLVSARRIYQAAGFALVGEQQHSDFGKPMTAQVWETTL
jgi:DNA-binding MarR family transcriptional regulator/GNAT superfamily N-acetyltransferase